MISATLAIRAPGSSEGSSSFCSFLLWALYCWRVAAIIMGAGFVGGEWLIIGNAFVFTLLAAGAVYGLAKYKGIAPETMILAGIAISYLFQCRDLISGGAVLRLPLHAPEEGVLVERQKSAPGGSGVI
ncbi:MAG: hypothetical protein WBI09_06965 [Methanothrix sp.]